MEQWTEIHLHGVDMHERHTHLKQLLKRILRRYKTLEYGIIRIYGIAKYTQYSQTIMNYHLTAALEIYHTFVH